MLSTVQQASLGLASALLGVVFAQTLRHYGQYLDAALAGLAAEFCLMSILLVSAIAYHIRQHRPAAVQATAGLN